MVINSAEDIGRLVRETRKAQGLTQADLALVSNVGVRFIVDLENGKQTTQIGKALHVIKMLGLSIEVGA